MLPDEPGVSDSIRIGRNENHEIRLEWWKPSSGGSVGRDEVFAIEDFGIFMGGQSLIGERLEFVP